PRSERSGRRQGAGFRRGSDHRTRKEAWRPLGLCLTDTAEADLSEIRARLATEAPEQIATFREEDPEPQICRISALPLAAGPGSGSCKALKYSPRRCPGARAEGGQKSGPACRTAHSAFFWAICSRSRSVMIRL